MLDFQVEGEKMFKRIRILIFFTITTITTITTISTKRSSTLVSDDPLNQETVQIHPTVLHVQCDDDELKPTLTYRDIGSLIKVANNFARETKLRQAIIDRNTSLQAHRERRARRVRAEQIKVHQQLQQDNDDEETGSAAHHVRRRRRRPKSDERLLTRAQLPEIQFKLIDDCKLEHTFPVFGLVISFDQLRAAKQHADDDFEVTFVYKSISFFHHSLYTNIHTYKVGFEHWNQCKIFLFSTGCMASIIW